MFSVSRTKLALGAVCTITGSYALLLFSAKPLPVQDPSSSVQQTSENSSDFVQAVILHAATFLGLLFLNIVLFSPVAKSRFGKALISVGNCKKPVHCPQSGHVVKVDNRPFMGAMAIAMSFVQLAIALYMVINGNRNTRLFPEALLYLDITTLATMVIFYVRFFYSNQFLYYGLFSWITPLTATIQAFACLYEVYMSFFTQENITEPMIRKDASVYSNCLVGTTIISIMQMLLLNFIQKRLYFRRPNSDNDANAEPVSKYLPNLTSDPYIVVCLQHQSVRQ